MEAIAFPYPGWFVILCLLLGAGFALGLYFRNRHFGAASGMPRRLVYLLAFLRFASISLIAFLLLGPVVKKRITERENPQIILLTDNSESIRTQMNAEDSARLIKQYEKIMDALSSKYEVAAYSFGSSLRPGIAAQFDEKSSNLSEALREAHNLYINRNVGAVILASDGIYNEGNSPVYHAAEMNAPVYTLALGDTSFKRDLRISEVYHNSILYLGDKMEVKIDIEAANARNMESTLRVEELAPDGRSKVIFSKKLSFRKREELKEESIIIEPERAGVLQYRVAVLPLRDEVNTENNSRHFFIEVLESRKKVLIVADAPHPDISALRQALLESRNYEVTLAYADDGDISPEAYNLIVLHGLPSVRYPMASLLKEAREARQSIWFIYSLHSDLNALNGAQDLLRLRSSSGGNNEARGIVNPDFSLFGLPGSLAQALEDFPPMIVPFGSFTPGPEARSLLTQKIGNVETKYPLLIYGSREDGQRIGILLGTGLWRWRLYDYLIHGDHRNVDALITQSCQYLSVTDDKRQFRVKLSKKVFDETETVRFSAELYNENYELVNDPDIELKIEDNEGKEFEFRFSKTGKSYRLDAGYFAAGHYRYRARLVYNGREMEANGQFIVRKVNLESLSTRARHDLLYRLSEETGGRTFTPDESDQLIAELMKNEELKPVLRDSFKSTLLLDMKWIFFLILSFLALEWFLRKYFGSY